MSGPLVAGTVPPPPLAALAVFIGVILAERMFELARSARSGRALIARGAQEHGRGHFPWIVLVHTLFPIALVVEVLRLGARPGRYAALWLALWVGCQLLRAASMWALGERWNVRVLVLPGEPPVTRGPYRWIQHPNYLAVLVETVAGPMAFGAWRTAIAFAAAQAVVLAVRIRCENRALALGEAPRTAAER